MMSGFFKDKKNIVILLLCVLFVIKIPKEGDRFALWIMAGVFLCASLDYIINRTFFKRKIFPNSAIISGFILSGILDYQQPWFILVIFSVLPIISKHLIKFNEKHIFNPANFALFFATIFKLPLTWNIESNIFLIIIFGIYLAYSYKKISHILGFLLFFTGLFTISKINPLTLISWFFVFIMLPEPKTSGFGALRGFIFGSIAGIACFSCFKFMPRMDPFVWSLFIANLARFVLEKIKI
jgi:Na+-transporting NADH:ubiquinone oxidoreductase subunit NqrB